VDFRFNAKAVKKKYNDNELLTVLTRSRTSHVAKGLPMTEKDISERFRVPPFAFKAAARQVRFRVKRNIEIQKAHFLK
jgi:hypothetical protein